MGVDNQPEQTQEYDQRLVTLLEALWGEGYLSPGGDAETALVLDGLDLRGRRVLDIGCGTGGCAFFIDDRYRPASVVGVDVEVGVVDKANADAVARGVNERVRFVAVEPGPLPFADGSFDVVFSKDSIVHIADKHSVANDVARLLSAGGVFACSDWMKGDDLPKSADLFRYEELEGLGFGLASPDVYFAALRAAGFERIHYTDRTAWLAAKTQSELDELDGSLRPQLEASIGRDFLDHELEVWRALCVVTAAGELGAGHFRAVKP